MKRLIKNLIIAYYTKEEQEKIFKEYKNSNKFGKRQLNIIYKALDDDFTKEQIDMFAKPEIDYKTMDLYRILLYGLKPEQIKFLMDSNFDVDQINIIREGWRNNFSQEQMNLYADPKFSFHQMAIIKDAIERGYTMEQLKLLSNPDIDPYEMLGIKIDFARGVPLDEIEYKDNSGQMKRLVSKKGFKNFLYL